MCSLPPSHFTIKIILKEVKKWKKLEIKIRLKNCILLPIRPVTSTALKLKPEVHKSSFYSQRLLSFVFCSLLLFTLKSSAKLANSTSRIHLESLFTNSVIQLRKSDWLLFSVHHLCVSIPGLRFCLSTSIPYCLSDILLSLQG